MTHPWTGGREAAVRLYFPSRNHEENAAMPCKRPLLHAACLALALCLPLTATAFEPPTAPDLAKTPGDVLTTDAATICRPGYTKTVRDVPQPLKDQVYRSYGITDRKAGEYEVDHSVSLELGGSNSARNLWPQS